MPTFSLISTPDHINWPKTNHIKDKIHQVKKGGHHINPYDETADNSKPQFSIAIILWESDEPDVLKLYGYAVLIPVLYVSGVHWVSRKLFCFSVASTDRRGQFSALKP
jgi:hypothetical protein